MSLRARLAFVLVAGSATRAWGGALGSSSSEMRSMISFCFGAVAFATGVVAGTPEDEGGRAASTVAFETGPELVGSRKDEEGRAADTLLFEVGVTEFVTVLEAAFRRFGDLSNAAPMLLPGEIQPLDLRFSHRRTTSSFSSFAGARSGVGVSPVSNDRSASSVAPASVVVLRLLEITLGAGPSDRPPFICRLLDRAASCLCC